ncbi:hypothetical protein P7K49_002136 [Saguinus oedipus]|uniref:Uncharacterized protein n=1 Tax=Saguinus oedipus TaxID=9490 RepID=A0ABQ9WH25_SAGOE|nr:hypothetical protein P7K49_002136 [Saguinus oedipus]
MAPPGRQMSDRGRRGSPHTSGLEGASVQPPVTVGTLGRSSLATGPTVPALSSDRQGVCARINRCLGQHPGVQHLPDRLASKLPVLPIPRTPC